MLIGYIQNSHDKESAYIPTNRGVGEENMIHMHNGVLAIKSKNVGIFSEIDRSGDII